jgi:hypothetical protein
MDARGLKALSTAAGIVALACGPAQAGTPSFSVGNDCLEHQAYVAGDEAVVDARLPDRYRPVRDPSSGRPVVFARALRCERMTIDARTAAATVASFGVVVESPDGRGCASAAPGLGEVKEDMPPICNWYVLSWLADDRRVVDWLRDGTPGFPAVYVPGLVFEAGAFDTARGGAPFHFGTPAAAPSPFTIDDVARERPGELHVRGGYWADTAEGTVKLALYTDDLTGGDATGVVRATPGSELAALLGAEERPYLPNFSDFAAVRVAHGSYRKQVLGPADDVDSFAGSCSFTGDVTFSPPATNRPALLTYGYQGRGLCSGTLNGREVDAAPARIHHTGRAQGICRSARTIEPGVGAIEFETGEVISDTLDFTSSNTEVDLELYGQRSGTAEGHATFVTPRTSPDVVRKCENEGVAETPLDLTLRTDSPLVSDRQAGQRRARRRMRVAVSPRSVRAGRTTVFRFRVTAPDGRPVRRAVVRFASRRARANRRGAARITATLRRPGRRVARVSKRGFRVGRVSVLVRRR